MTISFLHLENFRNFSSFSFTPDKKLNLIVGANASGKSSLLEAIFFLSNGKSFRSSEKNTMIKRNENSALVFANLDSIGLDVKIPVGIKKSINSIELHVNQKKCARISEVAKLLPVQIIHPESHKIIAGGPAYRREFLDWGVFHVEQDFHANWVKYKQVLRQRNAALKTGKNKRSVIVWDKELITYGTLITDFRRKYLDSFWPYLYANLSKLFDLLSCEIRLCSGWDESLSFQERLNNNLEKDMLRGFTSVGPHRANFLVQENGVDLEYLISRGQQKLLVMTLVFAQLSMLTDLTSKPCVLLIDDLEAELDDKHQDKVLLMLEQLNAQIFVTSISNAAFKNIEAATINLG